MSRENVDFRALYRAQTWDERAEVLERRASIFRTLGIIDRCCAELILTRRGKKFGGATLKEDIKDFLEILERNENELQKAWGLEPDPKWHSYWKAPMYCTCPKLDNAEMLGYGRIINEDCPLHGKHFCRGLK